MEKTQHFSPSVKTLWVLFAKSDSVLIVWMGSRCAAVTCLYSSPKAVHTGHPLPQPLPPTLTTPINTRQRRWLLSLQGEGNAPLSVSSRSQNSESSLSLFPPQVSAPFPGALGPSSNSLHPTFCPAVPGSPPLPNYS